MIRSWQLYFVLSLFVLQHAIGQKNLLERVDILDEIRAGLSHAYNYQFDESRKNLAIIKQQVQGHPAVPFLEAFIIYWENYPLTLTNPNAERFQALLEESYNISGKMLQEDPDNIEGIFFDLFGKAFYVMFWADNGKPAKVFPYLNNMYKQTIMGFTLKEQFNEFFFTTGLYNYYIVAYPEKHPAYKPIALLFRKGDKQQGLEMLKYSAENSIFLRVEARFFLSIIHLYYENDIKKASEHASLLYREFPYNSVYTGLYAQILLMEKKYTLADVLINNLEKKKDTYSSIQAIILRALYLEKHEKNYKAAYKEFQRGLELSQNFDTLTKDYTAISLMGIGRYYQRQSNNSAASRSFRMARNICTYDYIINDRL